MMHYVMEDVKKQQASTTYAKRVAETITIGLRKNMTTIKYYPSNRKLYNTETKAYARVEDVARMIKSGGEVRVVCGSTKNDVTDKVLGSYVAMNFRKFGTEKLINFIKENS